MGCEKPQITPGNFCVKLKVHGRDQVVLVLVKDRTPFFFRFQTHEVFGVEEARMVGPVVGTARLAGAVGGFRKRAKDKPCLIGNPDAFVGPDALVRVCRAPRASLHPNAAETQSR